CSKCGQTSAAASGCFLAVAALVLVGVICCIAPDLHGKDEPVRVTPTAARSANYSLSSFLSFGKLRTPIVVLQIASQYVAITGTSAALTKLPGHRRCHDHKFCRLWCL
ncbi:unnamed protein product, partial [Phaeothamnion confervicola]